MPPMPEASNSGEHLATVTLRPAPARTTTTNALLASEPRRPPRSATVNRRLSSARHVMCARFSPLFQSSPFSIDCHDQSHNAASVPLV